MNRYFSVDCEFSGLNPFKHSLISIGIVEVKDYDGNWQIMPELDNRRLYLEIYPTSDDVDQQSMNINKLSINDLKKNGLKPKEACDKIIRFLNLKPDDTAVFVAYCGVLDKIFLDKMFIEAGVENKFNYEIIEISSLVIGRLGMEWGFSEKDLEEYLGLSPMPENLKHNALSDAIHQAEEFCGIMNVKIQKKRLRGT